MSQAGRSSDLHVGEGATIDSRVELGGLELANPVMTAAGCAGTGRELARFFDIAHLGAITTKSVMVEPRAGRPTPRMAETPSGMLNAVGLQGPGIDVFLQRDLPWLLSQGAQTVVSIAGGSPAEYAELAYRLSAAPGVGGIEVNLAGPNLADHGRPFACDPAAAGEVVRAARDSARAELPVFAKLSRDTADPVTVAEACVDARADGLSMINTVRGMVIDTTAFRPAVTGGVGGLSGPAIRPIALACIHAVHLALPEVPIIGMGGVRTGDDVMQFMLAGASAVAVGTVIFHDPSACARVLREFHEALAERGITRAVDLVGAVQRAGGAAPEG